MVSRDSAPQGVAAAFFHREEEPQLALTRAAAGDDGALLGLAQARGDAHALNVLVHRLRALAAAAGQQATADELEALGLAVEELDRHLDAAGQPTHQVFLAGRHLQRMARRGRGGPRGPA